MKKNGSNNKVMGYGNTSFALSELSEELASGFDAWIEGMEEDFTALLVLLIDDDYKVSISKGKDGEDYCCSFTGKDGQKHNADVCLMSWADEPLEAFYFNFFKLYVVYEGRQLPLVGEKKKGRR